MTEEQQKSGSYFYPIKHWLLTLLIAPFVFHLLHFFYIAVSQRELVNSFLELKDTFFHFFLALGYVFSLPTFGAYLVVYYRFFAKSTLSVFATKTILNIIASAGVFITLFLLFRHFVEDTIDLHLAITYCLSIFVSSFFIKM